MSQYLVCWRTREGSVERRVEFPHYSQAEACLIGLVTQLEREQGGWAEIRHEERLVLRFGPESATVAANTSPARDESDMIVKGAD